MPVLYTTPFYSVEEPLVIEDLVLESNVTRPRNLSNGHQVRIGVKGEQGTEWLAVWNQAVQGITAGRRRTLLDVRYYRPRVGDRLVVEASEFGTAPQDLHGMTVTAGLRLTGNAAGAPEPLFTSVGEEGVDWLVRQLNASSLVTPRVTYWLVDA